ncbi:MAG: FAD-binding protein, partial [Salinivirgaceae bacterium]|nr:FAD-binding protein [Salinivirgaceae bacterium]
MIRKINTVLTPQQAYDNETTLITAAKIAKVNVNDIQHLQWINRSIDARKYPTKINATFELYIGEQPTQSEFEYKLKNVSKNKQIHIVGAGPAGYFAALELIENGLCPIIFERGKEISARKRDIALLSQNKEVNPESNYAFGEGGAGTFSDGKLYTRSKKKLEVRKVLELFHLHGAQNNILFEAHPHIGTDVLPLVIENIRKTIIKAG